MKKKRVLVIDDEQIVLDSVNKILKDYYEVDGTLKGRHGLDFAIHGNYDIVLTDIRMPDVGGMKVLRDIKRAKPSLPVMIITGYASVQSAVQAMKLGASDYVEKPFSPDDLISLVSSALDSAAASSPEEQGVVHREEMFKVLERAATDSKFIADLLYHGVDALDEYDLTGPEKLSLLTADLVWIEKQIGPLTGIQKRWLEHRMEAEIW